MGFEKGDRIEPQNRVPPGRELTNGANDLVWFEVRSIWRDRLVVSLKVSRSSPGIQVLVGEGVGEGSGGGVSVWQ